MLSTVNKCVTYLTLSIGLLSLAACKPDKSDIGNIKDAVHTAGEVVKQAQQATTKSNGNPYNDLPSSQSNVATATAAPTNCDDDFYNGKKPTTPSIYADNSQFLCFHGFAVLYSGKTKTPLWSAEHLSKNRMAQASGLDRIDNFHEEPRLTVSPARLSDYSSTGYDRGHLSPNADMYDRQSQFDSFSLANIAPQEPQNNRGVWADLEKQVRNMAYKNNDVYVVTGVLFKSANLKSLKGVLVPSHFYKAVYIPSTNQSMVFVNENTPNAPVVTMPMAQFQTWAGISFF